MWRASTLLSLAATALAADCPAYQDYATERHEPFSAGKYQFPYQRPDEACRTYKVDQVEDTIDRMNETITDPDLFRVFLNTWPNTLDTTVKWLGYSADNSEEELSFIITGDINAMWLRDSANQLQSYKPILTDSSGAVVDDIARLYRGAINLQARYIRQYPYCNSFQPPPEAGMADQATRKRAAHLLARDTVTPAYDPGVVHECKYELDSLAAFLELSYDYYSQTGDAAFFGKFQWRDAVKTILDTAGDMKKGTYNDDGTVRDQPYTWLRESNRATETVANNGIGEPVAGGTGLVRSFFRPSDDSCLFQFLVPSNMMFSRYLTACAKIMGGIDGDLAGQMENMAAGIVQGINDFAVVDHPEHGKIYAYEVDGFGSQNLMDDANIPSLLSIPFLGYAPISDPTYQRTRAFAQSRSNRYHAWGPVLDGIGGPHVGPGKPWPMSRIMDALTSEDDAAIVVAIKAVMGSTSDLGLIHESVSAHDPSAYTRPWFAWANGLFGQMLLDIEDRKPDLLKKSYQPCKNKKKRHAQ